jgi:hypothetical protein
MALRIAAKAIEAAHAERIKPTAKAPRLWRGLCLQFTRTMLGVPSRDPSAIAAWKAVPKDQRHPNSVPPPGVPVFWQGGTYGHVALSAGDGYVLSTDIRRAGKVDKVKIELIGQRWGYKLLGWTESLNGRRVWSPPKPVSVAQVRDFVERNGHYPNGRITKALIAEGFDNTIEGYASWQKACGYTGPDADGLAGRNTLMRLGAKHGFEVTD